VSVSYAGVETRALGELVASPIPKTERKTDLGNGVKTRLKKEKLKGPKMANAMRGTPPGGAEGKQSSMVRLAVEVVSV